MTRMRGMQTVPIIYGVRGGREITRSLHTHFDHLFWESAARATHEEFILAIRFVNNPDEQVPVSEA